MFSSIATQIQSPTVDLLPASSAVVQLSGNGVVGAQNNTHIDTSGYDRVVTRSGNVTQGTFTPFSSESTKWATFFNGTTDYVTTAASTDFAFGTSNFTIEFWVLPGGTTNQYYINIGGTTRQVVYTNSSGFLCYYVGSADAITGTKLTVGVWNHVALVRSGTTSTLFINLTQVGNTYADTTSYAGTPVVTIGKDPIASSYASGHLADIRIIKVALYSNGSQIPSSPLSAVSAGTNALLLTCRSNRLYDASPSARTLTLSGTPLVQPISPYSLALDYSASVGGGGYFDGTGDYLSVANATDLNVGNSDFTIECFCYALANPSTSTLFAKRANTTAYSGVLLLLTTGNTLNLYITVTGSTWTIITATKKLTIGSWTHIAFTRYGNVWSVWVNGELGGTTTLAGTVPTNTSPMTIGADGGGALGYPRCHISNFRLVKGTALYTAPFTAPTAPLTAVPNTQLLLSFTNAGVADDAACTTLETISTVRVSNTQSKYGGQSVYFDGTGGLKFPIESPTGVC